MKRYEKALLLMLAVLFVSMLFVSCDAEILNNRKVQEQLAAEEEAEEKCLVLLSSKASVKKNGNNGKGNGNGNNGKGNNKGGSSYCTVWPYSLFCNWNCFWGWNWGGSDPVPAEDSDEPQVVEPEIPVADEPTDEEPEVVDEPETGTDPSEQILDPETPETPGQGGKPGFETPEIPLLAYIVR